MSMKKGISIGAAMKQRMDKEQEVQLAVEEPAPAVAAAEVTSDDPLEPFNTRLPRSLQRRLKVHVALNGSKIQDVVHIALDEYLKKQEQ